jgi:ADP-ribose pyrophosphatase YjhB (NUDIX family)
VQTQCNESRIEFQGLGERVLTADFDGGNIVSDGGVPLLAEVDRMFRVLQRYAECFTDHRDPELIEHSVLDLVRQRIYGLCLGHEDLIDHDRLRADPLIAACVGKQDLEGQQRRREADRGMPMAGKSTLNRLELAKVGADPDSPYCKIVADLDGLANLLVDLFLEEHPEPPEEITLDIDPTDLGLFGDQLGRHFQKHYDGYCYLPLYVFCGESLLAAQLRPGDVGAMSGAMPLLQKIATRIRQRWPDVRIIVRGDGHFSDDRLMSWCEATPGLEFIVGLPGNARLLKEVPAAQRQMAAEFAAAREAAEETGQKQTPPRTFVEIQYRTLDSWSRPRRVVAKVEHLPGKTGDSVSASAVAAAERSAVQAEQRLAESRSAAAAAATSADEQQQRAERLAGLATTMTEGAPGDRGERAKSLRASAKSTRKQAQRAEMLARQQQRAAATAARRVVALQTLAATARTAADWLTEQASWEGKSNVRFVVLSRSAEELDGRTAYEDGYCPRGDAENRIKEQKFLFAGSLPCEHMRANQIRLYQSSFAYVLCMLLRRYGLAGTEMSQAQCPTIRTRLFKIGALVKVTTRRVWAHFSSSYPYRELFAQVLANLRRHAEAFARRAAGLLAPQLVGEIPLGLGAT